jgi:hypothetical protein
MKKQWQKTQDLATWVNITEAEVEKELDMFDRAMLENGNCSAYRDKWHYRCILDRQEAAHGEPTPVAEPKELDKAGQKKLAEDMTGHLIAITNGRMQDVAKRLQAAYAEQDMDTAIILQFVAFLNCNGGLQGVLDVLRAALVMEMREHSCGEPRCGFVPMLSREVEGLDKYIAEVKVRMGKAAVGIIEPSKFHKEGV